MAAFTLATGDRDLHPERLVADGKDLVQLVGLHFHCYVAARLDALFASKLAASELTQRAAMPCMDRARKNYRGYRGAGPDCTANCCVSS